MMTRCRSGQSGKIVIADMTDGSTVLTWSMAAAVALSPASDDSGCTAMPRSAASARGSRRSRVPSPISARTAAARASHSLLKPRLNTVLAMAGRPSAWPAELVVCGADDSFQRLYPPLVKVGVAAQVGGQVGHEPALLDVLGRVHELVCRET